LCWRATHDLSTGSRRPSLRGVPCAVDTGRRRRECHQPLSCDSAAAAGAGSVRSDPQAFERTVDGLQLRLCADEEALQLSSLVGNGDAFRVVLVVVRGEGLLVGQLLDLPLQGLHTSAGRIPLHIEHRVGPLFSHAPTPLEVDLLSRRMITKEQQIEHHIADRDRA
jgi:hypothetical protein